jgi:hypothetical protein
MPPTRVAEPRPAGKAESDSELAHASATPSPPTDEGATRIRTLQARVAVATTFAEQATINAASLSPSQEVKKADRANSAQPGNAEQNHAINAEEKMVALVMARPDIRSVADLAGKDVAIDEPKLASSGVVRSAIAAAGAAEVQLSSGHMKAIDRLIDGEVQAAVLTLVSKEAGDWFPDIAGFRVFRVPLSPVH